MFQLKVRFQAQGVFETATKFFCTKNPHSQRLGVWRKKSRVPPEGDALCVCARHGCRRVKDAVYLTSRLSWRAIQTQKRQPTKLIATIVMIAVASIFLVVLKFILLYFMLPFSRSAEWASSFAFAWWTGLFWRCKGTPVWGYLQPMVMNCSASCTTRKTKRCYRLFR